jgi:hypothetical protein
MMSTSSIILLTWTSGCPSFLMSLYLSTWIMTVIRFVNLSTLLYFIHSGGSLQSYDRPKIVTLYRPLNKHSINLFYFILCRRWDRTAVQWPGYGLDDWEITVGFAVRTQDPFLLWRPPSLLVNGVLRVLSIEDGHKADHLPAPSGKIKNERSYTSSLPYGLMACTGMTLHFVLFCVRKF